MINGARTWYDSSGQSVKSSYGRPDGHGSFFVFGISFFEYCGSFDTFEGEDRLNKLYQSSLRMADRPLIDYRNKNRVRDHGLQT
jgi:hypothetical protein